MRVCQVVEAASGGTGRHVIDLSRALEARGHDVTLVYSPLRADRTFEAALASIRGQIVQLPIARGIGWRDVAVAQALGRMFRRTAPFAVVHGHSSKAGLVVRLARVGQAARVYTPHALATLDPDRGAAARLLLASAERLLGARRTDALILLSAEELREAERLGLAARRRHLIANRLHGFAPTERDRARRALKASPTDLWIGFVGRLCAQKAPLQFVAVAIGAMRRDPRVRALMLGDGDLAPFVADAIAASDFADRFVWHRDADTAEWIAGLDLMLITSRYEGLPYVLLEALAAGVPVLSTDVGGARDLLGDGAGQVSPVESLSGALLALIADPCRLAAMRRAATTTGRACRSESMIDATEALYRRLTAS